MIGSSAGGMNIEEVAEKMPDKIIREYVDITEGNCILQVIRQSIMEKPIYVFK